MDFFDYNSMYDLYKAEGRVALKMADDQPHVVPPLMDYDKFYHYMTTMALESLQDNDRAVAFNQGAMEWSWHKVNKPYYKIYPNLLPMFADTRLDVPAEYLHSPFPTILIRLPKEPIFDFLRIDDTHFARSILVTEVPPDAEVLDSHTLKRKDTNQTTITLFFDFGESLPNMDGTLNRMLTYQNLRLKHGDIVEQILIEEQKNYDTSSPGIHIPVDIVTTLVRIAAATCFLATGADRIVEADVLNKDLLKYCEAKKKDDEQSCTRLHEKAKKRGKFGYTIGRELDFTVHARSEHEGTGEGRALSYQHQRSGHFHVVKYGPGKSQGKVQWFRQTTVRPDLPVPPIEVQRGYKKS